MKIQLSTWRKAVLSALTVFCLAVPAMATSLQLITTIDPSVGPPASGGGNSMNPIITPDGRYVLFASTADNLALTSSNTPFLAQSLPKINVFLRDRTNGTTILVSVNLAGNSGGNGDSIPIELSTNGQFALFESSASDLVSGDTNNAADVFVRDLVHGTNILVSIGTNGGCANGASGESAMTPNGRYVAFASTASNLVPGDTNGIRDIFVRDLQNGTTIRASSDALAGMIPVPMDYTVQALSSDLPEITPNGRYVALITSFAVSPPLTVPVLQEIFVKDLVAGTTVLVSSNVLFNYYGQIVGSSSYNHAISDNGQFVAFESFLFFPSSTVGVIQRYNLQTGFTDVVYTNVVTVPTGKYFSRNMDITPNGRFMAFVAPSKSLSGPSTDACIYNWDAQTATMTLVSCDINNELPINSLCDWPAIDSSGRFVVFLSTATGLTTNVVAGDFHLYLRDVLASSTILLDADTNGFGFPKDFLSPARLTPDSRFLVFDYTDEYPATNTYNQPSAFADRSLVPGDNNRACDVFVRDLTTNTTELVSVRQSALPSQTPAGSSAAPIFSVDTGGRFIAFASAANSLVPNYTNLYRGVFVQDLLNGTNVLVSADTNGLAGAGGMSSDPSISGDGRYVVFTSSASNLTPGDDKSTTATAAQDVFLRDLQTGITTLISTNATGSGPGNGDSYSPVISASGRFVLFLSKARNLTTDIIGGGTENLFLRDLQAGTTYALTTSGIRNGIPMRYLASMTPDGHFVAFVPNNGTICVWDSLAATTVYTSYNGGYALVTAISPDGNRIVYNSSNIGSGCYVTDRAANTDSLTASLPQRCARLQFSGDARFMVYYTPDAMLAFDTNGVADVYLYDFVTHSNFLVSQGNPSGAASGPSDSPAISNDGRFVAYRSTATNLVAGATNGLPNVFLYDRQTGVTTLLSFNESGTAGNNRSFAPQFSGDGQTVVFQSWASDLIPQDFNQVNDLVAIKIATSNPTPVFVGQMVFAPATLQSPTLTWPAVNGKIYLVQFKNSSTDAIWQTLSGNVWVSGSQGYATDLAPDASLRLYRVVAF